MVIFDAAAQAAEALAIGLVNPHDANFAPDCERLSRPLGTMRRNMESAVDELSWGEHRFGTAIESITT
jgi:hypothetical protein